MLHNTQEGPRFRNTREEFPLRRQTSFQIKEKKEERNKEK